MVNSGKIKQKRRYQSGKLSFNYIIILFHFFFCGNPLNLSGVCLSIFYSQTHQFEKIHKNKQIKGTEAEEIQWTGVHTLHAWVPGLISSTTWCHTTWNNTQTLKQCYLWPEILEKIQIYKYLWNFSYTHIVYMYMCFYILI